MEKNKVQIEKFTAQCEELQKFIDGNIVTRRADIVAHLRAELAICFEWTVNTLVAFKVIVKRGGKYVWESKSPGSEFGEAAWRVIYQSSEYYKLNKEK